MASSEGPRPAPEILAQSPVISISSSPIPTPSPAPPSPAPPSEPTTPNLDVPTTTAPNKLKSSSGKLRSKAKSTRSTADAALGSGKDKATALRKHKLDLTREQSASLSPQLRDKLVEMDLDEPYQALSAEGFEERLAGFKGLSAAFRAAPSTWTPTESRITEMLPEEGQGVTFHGDTMARALSSHQTLINDFDIHNYLKKIDNASVKAKMDPEPGPSHDKSMLKSGVEVTGIDDTQCEPYWINVPDRDTLAKSDAEQFNLDMSVAYSVNDANVKLSKSLKREQFMISRTLILEQQIKLMQAEIANRNYDQNTLIIESLSALGQRITSLDVHIMAIEEKMMKEAAEYAQQKQWLTNSINDMLIREKETNRKIGNSLFEVTSRAIDQALKNNRIEVNYDFDTTAKAVQTVIDSTPITINCASCKGKKRVPADGDGDVEVVDLEAEHTDLSEGIEFNKLLLSRLDRKFSDLSETVNKFLQGQTMAALRSPGYQIPAFAAPQPSHPLPPSILKPQTPKLQTPAPPRPKSVTFSEAPEERSPFTTPSPQPSPRLETPPNPASPSQLLVGADFFLQQVDSLNDHQIAWWAKVISYGNWGPLDPTRQFQPSKVGTSTPVQMKRTFIRRAIYRAFKVDSYGVFLIPPVGPVGKTKKATETTFDWPAHVYKGWGDFPRSSGVGPWQVVEPPVMVETDANDTEDLYYEDLYPQNPVFNNNSITLEQRIDMHNSGIPSLPPMDVDTNPWVDVQRNTGKRTYSQAAASRPNTPGPSNQTTHNTVITNQPPRPKRDTSMINPDAWIIRFPDNDKVVVNKLSESAIVDSVNGLVRTNPTVYRFKCLSAKWTNAGNITLKFSNTTKTSEVKKATESILERIGHKKAGATMTLNTPWTTIYFPNVPYRAHKLDEQGFLVDEMADADGEDAKMWTGEQILAELKQNCPLLTHATFPRLPTWTKTTIENPLPNGKGGLHVTVEDGDGSLSAALCNTVIHMWSSAVYPKQWKERINLIQCERCWTLGAKHDKCDEICRVCASTKHTETNHNISCAKCHESHGAETVSKPDFKCPHLRCKNCSQPHLANDESCRARGQKQTEIRAMKGRPSNQPILAPEYFTTLPSRQPTPYQAPQAGGSRFSFADNTPHPNPNFRPQTPHANFMDDPSYRRYQQPARGRGSYRGRGGQSSNRFYPYNSTTR